MKNLNHAPVTLPSTDADKVTGGKDTEIAELFQVTPPFAPIKPPVYYTLAIGEGGGDLPDLY